jgi:ABC-type protease/lipase transport system fused ATPase/permease subunit
MAFVSFMSSAAGRILRIVVGLGLIGWGVYLAAVASNMTVGIILAVVGLLPLAAGLLDVCVLAPLFGAPFSGAKARARVQS